VCSLLTHRTAPSTLHALRCFEVGLQFKVIFAEYRINSFWGFASFHSTFCLFCSVLFCSDTAVVFLRVRRDLSFVVLAFSRLICDSWAAMLLGRQLVELLASGVSTPLPRCPLAFAQIALREARILSGSDTVLAGIRRFSLRQWDAPLLHPSRAARAPSASALASLSLPSASQSSSSGEPLIRTPFRMSRSNIVAFGELLVLPDRARLAAADTTMLLCLTAWLVALQQTFGPADFVVGIWVSVRDVHPPGAAGLAAPLSSLAPLCVRLSRCRSFVDLFVDVGRRVEAARSRALCPPHLPSGCAYIPIQVEPPSYLMCSLSISADMM
jgi:hypothetical protein